MLSSIKFIKEKLNKNFDVKYREIKTIQGNVYIVFIDNLSDSTIISKYIIAPIIKNRDSILSVEYVKNNIVEAHDVEYVKNIEDALIHILSGDVIIVFEDYEDILFVDAKSYAKRSIDVPASEKVIKGPREGFNEVLVDNISLIRRKVKNPNLKLENLTIGEKSNTSIAIIYIEGVAPSALIKTVKEKLNSLKINFILDTSYIEENFNTGKTLFNTIDYTEKPDVVAANIMEGRVGVLVDGTPFVLTMPHFFIENFQMPDDYYINKIYSNVIRILRYVAFIVALLLPGLYIAITTYHFSLIPSVFVFRLSVSRAGVPFPAIIELYLLIFFFQILKEAGIRLPQPIGQAISIVGALILGDAAVGAGLASQIGMIVVAVSSIASFLIPKLNSVISVWSIIIVFFSSIIGLPGFYIGLLSFVAHLGSLDSVGYPYLYPLGTINDFKFRDIFFRSNLRNISQNIIEDDIYEKKNN
ncbi:GerA spore germination protein [Clostridium cochlearium]|uniref:GerA spore germination protein n=1 Tax=Clostridium cochlearium TaxID=1494 RepID=A0ABY0QIN9_CLOCO|nr:spore germination protein [Clostridium cochlearium]MCR1971023.1 spore germination protein [Clostridium cochlearium]SDK89617.1 GerA spore germination protein [Clostridium cochlearium]